MSMKRFCDRCGAIINPLHSYTPVNVGHFHSDNCEDFELCASCAYKLKKFLKNELDAPKEE